jgi:hypothetical protein
VVSQQPRHRRQWLDHLISLEEMNQYLKLKTKLHLKNNYTRAWLSGQKTQFITGGKL